MKYLELKVHPPIILILSILLAYVFSRYLPFYTLPSFFSNGYVYICAVGLLVCALGIWQFRQAKTTIDPTRPDKVSSLVSTGVYRLTRNPMYLGMLLILLAAVGKFADLSGGLAILFFMFYLTYFQIKPEERMIETLLGEEYLAYKNQVRRWL